MIILYNIILYLKLTLFPYHFTVHRDVHMEKIAILYTQYLRYKEVQRYQRNIMWILILDLLDFSTERASKANEDILCIDIMLYISFDVIVSLVRVCPKIFLRILIRDNLIEEFLVLVLAYFSWWCGYSNRWYI